MDWKLISKDGEFLQEVNCQFDACDFGSLMFGATKMEIDFVNKEGRILEVGEIPDDSTEEDEDDDF